MKKTLTLFERYNKLLEQDQMGAPESPEASADVQDVTEPAPESSEEMPLTSGGEEEYISLMVDAALFEPSPEEARTLMNLQSVMKLKRYTNAREEVLPTLLNIINASTTGGDIRKELNDLD